MQRLGLPREMVDDEVYARAVSRFREAGIVMPTFAQLADPATLPEHVLERLARVDPDAADPRTSSASIGTTAPTAAAGPRCPSTWCSPGS